MGVAKGIQFLHTGIVPGIFANDLKAKNVLLDQNLVAKISSYNLPVLVENITEWEQEYLRMHSKNPEFLEGHGFPSIHVQQHSLGLFQHFRQLIQAQQQHHHHQYFQPLQEGMCTGLTAHDMYQTALEVAPKEAQIPLMADGIPGLKTANVRLSRASIRMCGPSWSKRSLVLWGMDEKTLKRICSDVISEIEEEDL